MGGQRYLEFYCKNGRIRASFTVHLHQDDKRVNCQLVTMDVLIFWRCYHSLSHTSFTSWASLRISNVRLGTSCRNTRNNLYVCQSYWLICFTPSSITFHTFGNDFNLLISIYMPFGYAFLYSFVAYGSSDKLYISKLPLPIEP